VQPEALLTSGQPIQFQVTLDLAGLEASDLRVEALVGAVSTDGVLEGTETVELLPGERNGSSCVFSRAYVPSATGRLGYAFRVSPNHYHDPLTRPCGDPIRWA
jgi:glycogen phosphorylase